MEDYIFEWWHVLIYIPLAVLGAYINDYVRKNMRNK